MGTTESQYASDPIAQAVLIDDPAARKDLSTAQVLKTDRIYVDKPVVYFNGRLWSKGHISEITIKGCTVTDYYTQETHLFRKDSQAIKGGIMYRHAFFRRRSGQVSRSLCIVNGSDVVISGYKIDNDVELNVNRKMTRTIKQVHYVTHVDRSLKMTDLTLGKKVKLNIIMSYKVWPNSSERITFTYLHGFVYGLGSDNFTIITKLPGPNCCVKLVLPSKCCEYLSEPEEGDMTIKMLSPVLYENQAHIVTDISGDEVKLSGYDEYVPIKECEINLYDGTIEGLDNSSTKTLTFSKG